MMLQHAPAGGRERVTPLGDGLRRPLRILTSTADLEPSGGIELCLDEDTDALVHDGHSVEILYSTEGSMRKVYEDRGVALTGPFTFLFRPRHAVADLIRFLGSVRSVRRAHADVLWLNRAEFLVWAQFVARLARLPLVVHLHHQPHYTRLKGLSHRVARFVAVSEYTKQRWVERGVPADRITVLPNAVPLDKYSAATDEERQTARGDLGIAEGARVALYLGRLVQSKGVETLLEAWRAIDAPPERAVLILAGHDLEPGVARLLETFEDGRVVVLPSQLDVTHLLHASDVVVSPSLAPEAFGRVLIEAMSAGLPAVGTRQGGMAEILVDEMSAHAVEPADADQLAEVLSGLLDWRDTDPGLGARSRAFVETRFPYGGHVDGLETILRTAVSSRKPTPKAKRR